MKQISRIRKFCTKSILLITILLTITLTGVISIQSQNQNTNPLSYRTLILLVNTPQNQPISAKADLIWDDKIVNSPETHSNIEIILNGNLIIASGGSLILTNVILRANCIYNGEHHIEVQNGGALYINDTDGNPYTRADATIITAYDPSFKYLFWVQSGAKFQMNDSELSYCGFSHSNLDHCGLWINTNNTIIENNTFKNNYYGIILSDAHHNTIRDNIATKNDCGFYLKSSSYNILSGNNATNNDWRGFWFSGGSYNNLSGNTAANNHAIGFFMTLSSYNTLSGNNATKNSDGFWLSGGSYNNVSSNNATKNSYGFGLSGGSYNNVSGNTASNNGEIGFGLSDGSHNSVSGNTATNNYRHGFWVTRSSNNTFRDNIAINSKFGFYFYESTSYDLTGSIVANYLSVKVVGFISYPVRSAEVKIEVDGVPVYASPGFGGSNSTTNKKGLTEWIIVPSQTYIGGTWVENTTRVTISYSKLNITEGPRVVSTSPSHREIFFVPTPLSYLLLTYFMLNPGALNPLIYLACLVAFTITAVIGYGLWRRREKELLKQEFILDINRTDISRKPNCIYCGSAVLENAKFCIFCGKDIIEKCSVCNRDIISGDQIVRCPSCHIPSHRDHLLEWIKIKGYCPNCKEKLSRLDFL